MPAKHDLLRTLEEDSASTLYLAKDKKRGTECCMRRFKTRKPEEIDGLKELFNQLASVDNPHVEKALEFGTDKEGIFIITAPQEGENLEHTLLRGPLTAEEFEVVALQLLEALDVLHERAIVHGSVRPDYVRIIGTSRKDWRVVLGGFGQGFAVREDSKEAQIRAYRCTAPEQWLDGTTRRRTDVYALGCVLYEALTARAPFDGRAMKELRLKHLGHDVAPLPKLASHVPAWMCAWVMHLLAADPEQRPRKAAAARELFEKREAPPPPEPSRAESPAPTPPPAPTPTPAPAVFPAAPGPAPAPGSAPVAAIAASAAASAAALAQPVSAPVVLPASQTWVRNATSSTIPISAVVPRGAAPMGPGAGQAPRRPSAAAIPVPRKTMAQPPKGGAAAPAGGKKNFMPYIMVGGTVLALLGLFGLTRCGSKPAPSAKPAATKKK